MHSDFTAMSAYRERLRPLEQRLQANGHIRDIPGYIGDGAEFDVYEVPGYPQLVAKFPHHRGDQDPEHTLHVHTKALMRGLGIAGLERFVGYSIREPLALLCQRALGEIFEDIPETQRAAIPNTTLHQSAGQLAAHAAGRACH